jgi:hypothetical protein
MADFKDETGNRYGKLLVVKRVESKNNHACWLCKCDCGNEHITSGIMLRTNSTKSCGCLQKEIAHRVNFIDLTGKVFGKLTVVKVSGKVKGAYLWLCKCSCGKEKVTKSQYLIKGDTRSCGCLHKETTSLSFGESAFNAFLWQIKNDARKRNYSWMLTDTQVKEITKGNCFYCGIEPKQKYTRKKANGYYLYNGIDRVDNNRGYEIDNVVSCCGPCNRIKSDMSSNDFKEWIIKVYNKFIIGE